MGQYSLAEAKPIAAPLPTVAKGAYRLEEAKPLAQDGGIISSPPPSRRDSAGDAVSGVMDGLKEAIKAIPDAVRHPLDSAYQMFEASKDQYEKAVKAAGPGRDNKGDVAGFIQHAVGMFPVLGPMGSNLLDAVDSGADSYEVGKRAGNLLSLKVVPEITKKGIALAGKAVDVAPSPSGPRPPPPSSPVNVGKLMSTAKSGAVNVGVRVLEKAFGLPPGSGKIVKNIVEAVREEMAGKTTEVAPPTPTVVEAPPVASGTPVRPPLRGKQFGTFNDPAAPPLPAGVQPSGPVRPPVAAAAPAEMPALEQITEWLASRDGGTASRFTDPVVSEAPITKQTLGDIMDRLMKNRKVPAEVPPATVPAEVPPAAVETPQPATPAPVLYHGSPRQLQSLNAGSMMTDAPEWASGYTTKILPDGSETFTGSVHSASPQFKNPAPEATSLHGAEQALIDLAKSTGKPYTGGLTGAAKLVHQELGFDGIVARNAQGKVTGAIPFTDIPVANAHDPIAMLNEAKAAGKPIASNIQAALDRSKAASATPAPSAAGKPVTAATLMEEAANPAAQVNNPNYDWRAPEGITAEFKQYLKDSGFDVVPDRPEFDPTNPKAQGKFGGGAKTQVNMDAKANRFVEYLKANKMEPTPDNVARATQTLNEADHPSAHTLEKIYTQMGYDALDVEMLARSMAKAESPAPSATPKPPAKLRSKQTTMGELMEKAKSDQSNIHASEVSFDTPRSVSGKKEIRVYSQDPEGAGMHVTKDGVQRMLTIVEAPGKVGRYQVIAKPVGGGVSYQPGYSSLVEKTVKAAPETIGGSYSLQDAKKVAESYAKGNPHPFEAVERGVPISAYEPKNKPIKFVESRFSSGGFNNQDIGGANVWTDGAAAFSGKAPGPLSTLEKQPNIKGIWEDAAKTSATPAKAVGSFLEEGHHRIVFDNGTQIDGQYYDWVNKKYPSAEFKVGKNVKDNVTVWKDGKQVGVISPLRPGTGYELPDNIKQMMPKVKK